MISPPRAQPASMLRRFVISLSPDRPASLISPQPSACILHTGERAASARHRRATSGQRRGLGGQRNAAGHGRRCGHAGRAAPLLRGDWGWQGAQATVGGGYLPCRPDSQTKSGAPSGSVRDYT